MKTIGPPAKTTGASTRKRGDARKAAAKGAGPTASPDLLEKRIELLTQFNDALRRWNQGESAYKEEDLLFASSPYQPTRKPEHEADERLINRNMMAVRGALQQVGLSTRFVVNPPSAIGGYPIDVDPLSGNLFGDFYGFSPIESVIRTVEQAIGACEHLRDGTGLVAVDAPKSIELVGAMQRALRPMFGNKPPRDERAVQDVVEVVLNSLGMRYSRDKETAAVGARGFRPDFSLTDEETALEVKLAKQGHGASQVQEEIAADITGYKTRWKRLIVVVYDVGVIANPTEMERENMKHFGVTVVVVKH